MTAITEPEAYWSPGTLTTPAVKVRVWTRDHAPFDVARTKGRPCSTAEVSSHVWGDPVSGYFIHSRFRDNAHNDEPTPLDGRRFDTAEEADRVRFNAGHLVFEETLQVGAAPNPYAKRPRALDPEDRSDYDWDPDGRRADGMAADMVYGRGR